MDSTSLAHPAPAVRQGDLEHVGEIVPWADVHLAEDVRFLLVDARTYLHLELYELELRWGY